MVANLEDTKEGVGLTAEGENQEMEHSEMEIMVE